MSARFKGCLLLAGLFALLLLSPFLWRWIVTGHYGSRIYEVASVPAKRTAIVFGAAVFRSGSLSTVLRDRMDTAIQLYNAGSVDKLLLSGDGASTHYDEPGAMKRYAMRQGVHESDILVDRGGRSTYDSCYRARHSFEVQDAILVTQEFHLSRALFICDWLQINAVGVSSDQRTYRAARWYELRETAATFVALGDVLRQREPTVTTILPASSKEMVE